jgi:hypothetical protein
MPGEVADRHRHPVLLMGNPCHEHGGVPTGRDGCVFGLPIDAESMSKGAANRTTDHRELALLAFVEQCLPTVGICREPSGRRFVQRVERRYKTSLDRAPCAVGLSVHRKGMRPVRSQFGDPVEHRLPRVSLL